MKKVQAEISCLLEYSKGIEFQQKGLKPNFEEAAYGDVYMKAWEGIFFLLGRLMFPLLYELRNVNCIFSKLMIEIFIIKDIDINVNVRGI